MKKMAVVLFVDVVDSAELSNVLSYEQYDEFISDFQQVAKKILSDNLINNPEYSLAKPPCWEATIRGDELCVILYSGNESDLPETSRRDVKTAMRLAIEMKRKWLSSERNIERVIDNKSPIHISIGINAGYVIVNKHHRISSGRKLEQILTGEGFAINLAKRIEGHSRTGKYSKIFVGRSVFNILSVNYQIAFDDASMVQFKGISQTIPVYEVKSFGHVEDAEFKPKLEAEEMQIFEKVIEQNPHDLWVLFDLAHQYYDNADFGGAAEKCKLAIDIDPAFSPAYIFLGRAFYRDYRDEEALHYLELAYQKNPDSARANNFLAVCLRRMALRGIYSQATDMSSRIMSWKQYFNRAMEHHRKAMHLVGNDPCVSKWPFNAYAMTLAQAAFGGLLDTPDDKIFALNEALHTLQDVLATGQQNQKNLFLHVEGFIRGAQGQNNKARTLLLDAIHFLTTDKSIDTKKFREKVSELYFHLGLLGLEKKADTYRRAITTAFSGDLPKNKNTISAPDFLARKKFVEDQYWFNKVKSELESNNIQVSKILQEIKEPKKQKNRR
jgi:class 3 adenylate cyclase